MSHAAARTILALQGKSSKTGVLAICLEAELAQKDGIDAQGRSIVLVGKHRLDTQDTHGPTYIKTVLEHLREGQMSLPGLHVVSYKPQASAFITAIVEGPAREVLAVGSRETGKSQASPAAVAILAEYHHRAGFPLPFIGLVLADTLISFEAKLLRSLTKEAMWGALWSAKNDNHQVNLSLKGLVYCQLDAVGVLDHARRSGSSSDVTSWWPRNWCRPIKMGAASR